MRPGPLTRAAAEELLGATSGGGNLPSVLVQCPEDANLEFKQILGYLVQFRMGGFMVLLPYADGVQLMVESFEKEDMVDPLFHNCQVALGTARQRLGSVDALLVDLPWSMVGRFTPGSLPRSAGSRRTILHFTYEGTIGRPDSTDVSEVAAQWVSQAMDDETAQDYLTGNEMLTPEGQPPGLPLVDGHPDLGGEVSELDELRRRTAELERELASARKPPGSYGSNLKSKVPRFVCEHFRRRKFEQGTMGSSSCASGFPASKSCSSRDQKASTYGHYHSRRRNFCRDRERGCGPRCGSSFGLDSTRWRSDPTASDDTDGPEPAATPEVAGEQTLRPGHGFARWGQRKRQQFKRSQGLHGSGSLSESHPGPQQGFRSGSEQCRIGVGHLNREDRCKPPQEVRGTPDPFSRPQVAEPCGNRLSRRVVCGVRNWKCGFDGVLCQDDDVCGASGPGLGQVAARVAPPGLSRTCSSPSLRAAKNSRTEAILPVEPCFVDISKSSISERFGLPGVPAASLGKTGKSSTRSRGPRGRSQAKAEASTSPKRKGQGVGGRFFSSLVDEDEQLAGAYKSGSHYEQDGSCIGVSHLDSSLGVGGGMPECGHSQTSRISPNAAFDLSPLEEFPERVLDSDAPSRSVAFLEAPGVLPDLGKLNKDSFIDPLRLVNSLCNVVLSIHTGLTSFIRSALRPVVTCKVQLDASSSSLWPVPPPRFCWTASARLGPKRRRRKRFYEMKHRLVQLIISALNWAELGHPSVAPERASVGAVISPSQHAVIERIESLVTHFLHVGHFTRDDLGRSFEKFQDLIRCCEELPFVSPELGFVDLDSFLSFCIQTLIPTVLILAVSQPVQNMVALLHRMTAVFLVRWIRN